MSQVLALSSWALKFDAKSLINPAEKRGSMTDGMMHDHSLSPGQGLLQHSEMQMFNESQGLDNSNGENSVDSEERNAVLLNAQDALRKSIFNGRDVN